MISYLQAARELDARWTGSLQFLPPTPVLRSDHDCAIARQIANAASETGRLPCGLGQDVIEGRLTPVVEGTQGDICLG